MKNLKSSGSLKRIRQGPAGTGLLIFLQYFLAARELSREDGHPDGTISWP
jgi:hypothetical protein